MIHPQIDSSDLFERWKIIDADHPDRKCIVIQLDHIAKTLTCARIRPEPITHDLEAHLL